MTLGLLYSTCKMLAHMLLACPRLKPKPVVESKSYCAVERVATCLIVGGNAGLTCTDPQSSRPVVKVRCSFRNCVGPDCLPTRACILVIRLSPLARAANNDELQTHTFKMHGYRRPSSRNVQLEQIASHASVVFTQLGSCTSMLPKAPNFAVDGDTRLSFPMSARGVSQGFLCSRNAHVQETPLATSSFEALA